MGSNSSANTTNLPESEEQGQTPDRGVARDNLVNALRLASLENSTLSPFLRRLFGLRRAMDSDDMHSSDIESASSDAELVQVDPNLLPVFQTIFRRSFSRN